VIVGAKPWDTEWAAERAAEALRYLGRNYPECLENLRVLDEHLARVWAEADRKAKKERAEESRAGMIDWYRRLQAVYAKRSEECARAAESYEAGA
jgi:hypothetical protein